MTASVGPEGFVASLDQGFAPWTADYPNNKRLFGGMDLLVEQTFQLPALVEYPDNAEDSHQAICVRETTQSIEQQKFPPSSVVSSIQQLCHHYQWK